MRSSIAGLLFFFSCARAREEIPLPRAAGGVGQASSCPIVLICMFLSAIFLSAVLIRTGVHGISAVCVFCGGQTAFAEAAACEAGRNPCLMELNGAFSG